MNVFSPAVHGGQRMGIQTAGFQPCIQAVQLLLRPSTSLEPQQIHCEHRGKDGTTSQDCCEDQRGARE